MFLNLLLIHLPVSNSNSCGYDMKQLTIFRVLTYILLPIAGVFGLMDIFMLLIALSNIPFLFTVFMIAAFVIYVFASLKFLTKGIDTGRPCKASLRDWIRVNAFVTVFMSVTTLISVGSILMLSDTALHEMALEMKNSIKDAPPLLNPAIFVKAIKTAAWFMGALSLLLLVHITMNFRLMKQHRHLFQAPSA